MSHIINCHYLMYYTSHLFQQLTWYFVILLLPYLFFWQVNNNKKAKQSIMCCWRKHIFIIQQLNSSTKPARCQEKIGIAMDTRVSVSGHSEGTQVQLCSSVSPKGMNSLLSSPWQSIHPSAGAEALASPSWQSPFIPYSTPFKGFGSQHPVLPPLLTHPRSKQEPLESYNFIKYNRWKPYSSLSVLSPI